MLTVRIETTIDEKGEVRLTQLPFKAGEKVIVTVHSRDMGTSITDGFPLRGVPIEYERPTDPVAETDWSAMK